MKILSQTAVLITAFSFSFLHTSADIAYANPAEIQIGVSCGGITVGFCDTPFVIPSGQDPVKVS